MTYNVFGGTLNLAHSLTYCPHRVIGIVSLCIICSNVSCCIDSYGSNPNGNVFQLLF